MRHQAVIVNDIHVGRRWRSTVNEKTVGDLVSSINEQGLRYPISVVFREVIDDDGDTLRAPALVAGRHRLEAIKRLGWKTVECDVFDDEVKAEKWEISENLHRADLTVEERAHHIARWIALTEKQIEEGRKLSKAPEGNLILSQAAKVSSHGGKREGSGQPESGVNAAARELGIPKDEAYRARAIAAIPESVAVQARELDLSDNKGALVKIGRAAQKALKKAIDDGKPEWSAAGAAKDAAQEELESILDQKTAPDEADRKSKQRDKFWKMVGKMDHDVREEIFALIRSGNCPA